MRRACRVSAGLKDVLREVIDDAGDCLLRNWDLVALSFRRILCGTSPGMDDHKRGKFVFVNRRDGEELSPRDQF